MILLKSCPRCTGDLVLEDLPGEADFVCLQCGYRTPAGSQLRRAAAALKRAA